MMLDQLFFIYGQETDGDHLGVLLPVHMKL